MPITTSTRNPSRPITASGHTAPATKRVICHKINRSLLKSSQSRTQRSKIISCSASSDANILYGFREDGIYARPVTSASASLINKDLSPTVKRTFSALDMVWLWTGLTICVPSYALAAGLIELGMSLTQGVLTVFLGNLITLIPMILNGAPGTKYGIPFPVLARASFGIRGALLPSLVRGAVACGWFGIQTFIGSQALYQFLTVTTHNAAWLQGAAIVGLGISVPQLACFTIFWAVQLAVLLKGMEGIRKMESYGAPVLIAMCAALLVWAVTAAGGWQPLLAIPSQFDAGGAKAGQFWSVFFPVITANVGFWATLALNVPDFTRFAKSQRAQVLGQAVGLPITMALFAFLAMTVTAATTVIFGSPVGDPIALVGRLEGILPISLGLAFLVLATLTTNIAANVVAPVNALVAADPQRFTFQKAAIITSILGAAIQPWRLISSTNAFIFKWLIGSSCILAPVCGILLVDYYLIRGARLNIDALYTESPTGRYYYSNGWNPAAVWALMLGALPTLPGFCHEMFGLSVPSVCSALYNGAWFVGCGVGALVYWVLMREKAVLSKGLMPAVA